MGDYVEFAKYLIKVLYDSPDGGVGGYGHIVFDDDNIEDGHIKGCIEDAVSETAKDWMCEETRIASINALSFFLLLTEAERNEVLGIESEDDENSH